MTSHRDCNTRGNMKMDHNDSPYQQQLWSSSHSRSTDITSTPCIRVSEPLDDTLSSSVTDYLKTTPLSLNWFLDNSTSTSIDSDSGSSSKSSCGSDGKEDDESNSSSTFCGSDDDDESFFVQDGESILQDDPTATAATTKGHQKKSKRVRFSSHVGIREYAVTVGDAPTCRDSCPLSLDWAYYECSTVYHNLTPSMLSSKSTTASSRARQRQPRSTIGSSSRCSNNGAHGRAVQRLSVHQRRQRVARVRNWTHEQVRAMEIERVLQRLDEAMEQQQSQHCTQGQPQEVLRRSGIVALDNVEEKDDDDDDDCFVMNHRLAMAVVSRELEAESFPAAHHKK